MSQEMNQEKNAGGMLHQWKSFIRVIRYSKVPWYLFLLSFAMDAVAATLFVKLPVLLGDIMAGEIFAGGMITQYGLLSIAQVAVNFASVTLFCWVDMKVNISGGVGIWLKIIQMPMRVLDKERPSTLTSRVTDDSTGVGLALSGIFNCLSTIYTLIIVYVEMFQMNTQVSLMLLIIPVWLLISMKIIGGMSYRTQKKIQDTLSAFTSYLSVRLPNMRLVKAFGMEWQEVLAGNERIGTQYRAGVEMVKVQAVSSALQNLSTAICNVVVLAYGGYLTGTGAMDVGDLITFFLFVSQGSFAFSAETLLMYYQNVRIGLGACSKIMEMMEEEEERMEAEKSFTVPAADLRFENVSFSYGEQPVLKDVTLTVPYGKTTAIVGANGSGKTTLLKLLERFYNPDSGEITYGGENIQRFHLKEWRDSVGYVVQNSPLLQGTIAENIAYGMEDPSREDVERAAREADAYDFIMAMEQGFDSEVGELGNRLSGGQRQKLAIARALVAHPDMILLDEATCGLDACSEQELRQMLDKLLVDKTVVLVAHDVDTIRSADQIVLLDEGRVAGIGTHEELIAENEVYQNYFHGQPGKAMLA